MRSTRARLTSLGTAFLLPCVAQAGTINTSEPTLEYVVELNGQPVELADGQTRDVTLGSTQVKARLVIKPTRLLQAGEVTLRYPRDHEFTWRLEDDLTGIWSLEGRDDLIVLMAVPERKETKAKIKERLHELAGKAGEPVRTLPTAARLGGARRTGERFEFKKDAIAVVVDVFRLENSKADYVLIFADYQEKVGVSSSLVASARKTVEETITIAK